MNKDVVHAKFHCRLLLYQIQLGEALQDGRWQGGQILNGMCRHRSRFLHPVGVSPWMLMILI